MKRTTKLAVVFALIALLFCLFAPQTAGAQSATLNWQQPVQSGIASTNIYRNAALYVSNFSSTILTYVDSAVVRGLTYVYDLTNVDVNGVESTPSNSVSATIPGIPPPPPVTVTINPPSAALLVNATQQFTATVTGSTNTAVTWAATVSCGVINATGLYTAPSTAQTCLVTATSQADATVVASANVTVSAIIVPPPTGQTLFTTQIPALTGNSDGSNVNYELGAKFQSNASGQIIAIRFWKDAKESGTHTGHIWSSTGTLLSTVVFAGETASGWQRQALSTPLNILVGTTYTVSVNTGSTFYVATNNGFASQIVSGNLSSVIGGNGTYGSVGAFPTNTYQSSNYFRDIVFVPGIAPPPPVTITIAPLAPSIPVNRTVQFVATVTNTVNTAVTWSANAPAGLFTAPATAGTATVTATSVTDPTKVATTIVTITPPSQSMTTHCVFLPDGVTWDCQTLTVNMPAGQAIKSVVTSGTLTNTTPGVHP